MAGKDFAVRATPGGDGRDRGVAGQGTQEL
jgi:hypothetical protein